VGRTACGGGGGHAPMPRMGPPAAGQGASGPATLSGPPRAIPAVQARRGASPPSAGLPGLAPQANPARATAGGSPRAPSANCAATPSTEMSACAFVAQEAKFHAAAGSGAASRQESQMAQRGREGPLFCPPWPRRHAPQWRAPVGGHDASHKLRAVGPLRRNFCPTAWQRPGLGAATGTRTARARVPPIAPWPRHSPQYRAAARPGMAAIGQGGAPGHGVRLTLARSWTAACLISRTSQAQCPPPRL